MAARSIRWLRESSRLRLARRPRRSRYAMDKRRKTYCFTVRWGATRPPPTICRGRSIIATSEVRPDRTREDPEATLPRFAQALSTRCRRLYSALKDGWSNAILRSGARRRRLPDTEISRPVTRFIIYRLIDMLRCQSRGIRSGSRQGILHPRRWPAIMAKALGTEGHVAELARGSMSAKFSLDHAISLEKLERSPCIKRRLTTHLLPIETALDDIPALALTETEASEN